MPSSNATGSSALLWCVCLSTLFEVPLLCCAAASMNFSIRKVNNCGRRAAAFNLESITVVRWKTLVGHCPHCICMCGTCTLQLRLPEWCRVPIGGNPRIPACFSHVNQASTPELVELRQWIASSTIASTIHHFWPKRLRKLPQGIQRVFIIAIPNSIEQGMKLAAKKGGKIQW